MKLSLFTMNELPCDTHGSVRATLYSCTYVYNRRHTPSLLYPFLYGAEVGVNLVQNFILGLSIIILE